VNGWTETAANWLLSVPAGYVLMALAIAALIDHLIQKRPPTPGD
jgi:hypothetical protein